MKQLYVKATGVAYGPPAAEQGKKSKSQKTGVNGKGDGGQPKQMDTRKADKARKVRSMQTRLYGCG